VLNLMVIGEAAPRHGLKTRRVRHETIRPEATPLDHASAARRAEVENPEGVERTVSRTSGARNHDAGVHSQGLRTSTPIGSKSRTLRVTTVMR
jgi:hypothetical protein